MAHFAGFATTTVQDISKKLNFPALVVYPTDANPNLVTLGPYSFEAAQDAQIANGEFPVIVISHGSGGSHLAYRTLAIHLAKNGYIVAIPEHPFNNRNNNEHADTIENMINRPEHIRLTIDAITSDHRWSQAAQKNKVALIGHSMGAYTALALSGGVPHTKHQIEHDPECKITLSQEITVEPDPRIKALVLFAPAAGWFLSAHALEKVKIPILIFSSEHDHITPLFHAEIIIKGVFNPAQVDHRIVKNGGHFSFLSPFPANMRNENFLPAQDPPGFDRVLFQEHLQDEVLFFLNRKLEKQKNLHEVDRSSFK